MPLKMAKASSNDMESAFALLRHLDRISEGVDPRGKDEEEELAEIDRRDPAQLAGILDLLISTAASPPSGLSRVIWGMGTVLDSGVLDPDLDFLEVHPRIQLAQKLLERQGAVEPIPADAPRCIDGLSHRGFEWDRTKWDQSKQPNRREAVFAQAWERESLHNAKRNTGAESLLAKIMVKETITIRGNSGFPSYQPLGVLDQNAASVAASAIQWLGTNVGFEWLLQVLADAGYVVLDGATGQKLTHES